jgi:hypothetical protein
VAESPVTPDEPISPSTNNLKNPRHMGYRRGGRVERQLGRRGTEILVTALYDGAEPDRSVSLHLTLEEARILALRLKAELGTFSKEARRG